MLVSHTHRFIYIHVGKTGGMSMREVLKTYAQEPDKFRIRRPPAAVGDRPNPLYKVWETLLLHAKARDVQKELPPEIFGGFYKFAFVRNPWDLMVSMYHFILREPKAAKHDQVKALGSFDAFVEWAVKEPEPFPKGITRLQKEMLTDSEGNLLVDFVGRYETLHRDFAAICEKVRIDNTLPHLNRSQHLDYRTYYTPETRRLVEESFQADIECFNYSFAANGE